MEIAIWSLQLLINYYVYRKVIQKQILKFQVKLRLTTYFYFIALTITIVLSIAVKILKGYKDEDGYDFYPDAIKVLDIIKYPMLNLVDITFIDFGLTLMIIETQVFLQAKSA